MGSYFPRISPTWPQYVVKVRGQQKNGTENDEILTTTINKNKSITTLIVKLGSCRLHHWIDSFDLQINSKKFAQRWRFIIEKKNQKSN